MALQSRFLNPDRLFLAIVISVDYQRGVCTLSFFKPNDRADNIVVAQPYTGRGWGVFCGVEPGTICVCAHDHERKVYIVAYLPDLAFMNEAIQRNASIGIDEFPFPRVVSGEIVLQSKSNARFAMNRFGDISLETPTGDRVVLDATTDTFEILSAQKIETCEAFSSVSGAIKRDVRTPDEKLQEPLTGVSSSFGFNLDSVTELIGFDPTYKPSTAPALSKELLEGQEETGFNSNVRADIQEAFDSLPNGLADLSLGETGSSLFKSDAVNPPLTEVRTSFYEFADSNVGLDQQQVTDELKAVGKFDNNVIGRLVYGTYVNEVGKILRFDYGFDDGQMGHALMWNTLGINVHVDGKSTDDFFDRNNTLREPKGEIREDFEWTVETLESTDAATFYDFTLRTRGVNYNGVEELEETGGKNWFLRIAKDGLTKLNIPAATSLNAKQFHREGRSLLANFDGSIEATIGKQVCTKEKGLDRVVGITDDRANFVNMNNYPNYGRKDRSVGLDLQGNLELLVGGDSNVNQSIMLQADGSLSAFFGKEVLQSNAQGVIDPLAPESGMPISTACLASDRKDRSITVRTIGNVEAHIHKDTAYGQSLMVTTEGGNRSMWGKDKRNRSWDVQTTGGVRIEVQGPMQKQNYALEIDLEGNMHIYVNGKVDIHSTGDMRLETDKNLHLDVEQNFNVRVGKDMNVSVEGSYREAIKGNKSEKVTGNRITSVLKNEDLKIGGNRQVSTKGNDSTTALGVRSIRGNSNVNIDGGIVNINTGASSVASPGTPTAPQAPEDIFVSEREAATILVGTSSDQILPNARESDKTGKLPENKQLEETVDPKSNRIVNPFEEEQN